MLSRAEAARLRHRAQFLLPLPWHALIVRIAMHPGILGQQEWASPTRSRRSHSQRSQTGCNFTIRRPGPSRQELQGLLAWGGCSLGASTGTCARGGWPTEHSIFTLRPLRPRHLRDVGRALARRPEPIDGTALRGIGTHGPQLPGLSPN